MKAMDDWDAKLKKKSWKNLVMKITESITLSTKTENRILVQHQDLIGKLN